MTRKDYVKVAEVLRKRVDNERAKGNEYSEGLNVLYSTVSDMAIVFANDNPRFDMQRFFVACGFHN